MSRAPWNPDQRARTGILIGVTDDEAELPLKDVKDLIVFTVDVWGRYRRPLYSMISKLPPVSAAEALSLPMKGRSLPRSGGNTLGRPREPDSPIASVCRVVL